MPIVGLDGHEISSEKQNIRYEVGGVRIETPETPEVSLQRALEGAQILVGQQVGQAALNRSGSHVVAQAEAQTAASKVTNPFHLEPGALAVFMLMSREIEHRDRVIEALAKRLDAIDGQDSTELLKKQWAAAQIEQVEKSEDDSGSEDEENDV
jgi:hypothetical protein